MALSGDRVLVLGGDNFVHGGFLNDVWLSSDAGKTWPEQTSAAGWSKRKGHAGHVPGCPVCLMCRKNVRKRHAVKDPPTERRVGYRWAIDGLTWPVRSRSGDRYTLVLRDYASGLPPLPPLR